MIDSRSKNIDRLIEEIPAGDGGNVIMATQVQSYSLVMEMEKEVAIATSVEVGVAVAALILALGTIATNEY